MKFELRHLRNFVVVAEELHFGRAASRLAITQPPLSVSIQQLELAVGARLLERDSRGVRLTAAGAVFRDHAREVLLRANEAGVLAREIGAGAAGRLRVGFVGSLLYRGLPEWLRRFQAAHPRIEVALNELNSSEQIEAVQRNELELGIILAQRVPDSITIVRLFSEPFVCCLPLDHELTRQPQVTMGMLRAQPFVLFSRRVSPEYYASIIDMCAAAGFHPRVRHELRHWLSVVALVAQGAGVSILPAALQRSGMAGVTFRPIVDSNAVTAFSCIWPAGADHPAREMFLRHIAPDADPCDNPPEGSPEGAAGARDAAGPAA